MDWSGFGALARNPMIANAGGGIPQGGILGQIMKAAQPAPGAAPQVPADGAMQPTIGPGMPAAPAPQASPGFKFGLPQGGILGLLRGQSPQGIMGMLQRGVPGMPLAGRMPQAGMMMPPGGLPGMPGAAQEGPVAPVPKLPMNINPMDNY